MIYEHAHITIDADKRTEFEDAFARAKKYLLDANGGKTVEIVRSVDDPGLYLLRVGWDSVEDHTEVFATSINGKLLAEAIGGFFTETPSVAHFEDAPV
ncbi:antibiotic biosynthesis monooxygenase family protein [Rhodococcus sp. NPDC059968]|uniref:antibiotic biosynthesis monooxygenase family protein n=1 Tax=Rhodococcus sp. NPDC059968 TaxID=3347017 RepID=UPI00366D8F23